MWPFPPDRQDIDTPSIDYERRHSARQLWFAVLAYWQVWPW